MRKGIGKRICAMLLLALMTASIAACGPKQGSDGGQDLAENGKIFADGTEISIAISSDPTWPNRDDWKLWQYIQEATGAKLTVQAIPTEDYQTKVSLMMSSPEKLPDLLHITQKKMVDQNANMGALLAFDDNLDKLPNYQKFIDTLSENEAKDVVNTHRCADGKIYNGPAYGTQTVNNARAWMYRKDIFEKNNLEIPQTYDELYEVCKKLKQIYPTSYPLCFRNGFQQIRMMGPQWQPYHSFDIYYDFENKVWKFGMAEPVTRDMVEWLAKMVKEGLAPPNMVDIKTKEWEELVARDRGFITLDYIVRIDYFNQMLQPSEPSFELALMQPPKSSATEGYHKMCRLGLDLSGYAVCNTGKTENVNNAFKFIDWMYTDEATELLSWGKEGETYEMKDGKREFILPKEDDTPRGLYGISSFGLYQRLYPEAYEATYTEKQITAIRDATQYLEDYVNPMWWLSLTDEETSRATDIDLELGNYCQMWVGKFIAGQEPISKWDEFVAGMKEFDVDEYIAIYSAAYQRAMGE